jgi:pentachlorophenol monooxygenase/3-(3-hydroxy-phenyl)propionate hydroxylase
MQISGSPIVVVGNGPVGQTAALLLARWGVPVILLDERPARDAVGSKAICQQRDVLDIWESVGAGAKIADEGITWRTVRTFYKDQQLFSYNLFDSSHSALPPFVNISQARTEEILDEQIARQPLISVQWEFQVVHIDQSESGVEVRCETNSGPRTIPGSFALVCSGARSGSLRRDIGITFDGVSFDDRFLICDILAELPGWANERRFYFDPEFNPGRQVLIHPCPHGMFRIDWQVSGNHDLESEVASGALDARIRKIIGDRAYQIVWKSVYRFHSRRVDRMRIGRILVAGDCAHLLSPFGARGLNSGVADAENAAWKLAFVYHRWANPRLLESYDHERRRAAIENLEVTTRTMEFLAPRTDEQMKRRTGLLERALTDPTAWSEIDSGRFSEPYWYVDSPLTTLDINRPFAGRPSRGEVPPPAPGVLIPDVPITMPKCGRLRQICRDGVLLLAGEDVELEKLQRAISTEFVSGAPIRIMSQNALSPDGCLAASLGSQPNEVWVIRPDSHIAAVLSGQNTAELILAIHRLLGQHEEERTPGFPTRTISA